MTSPFCHDPGFIYLASPYSHTSKFVRHKRYLAVLAYNAYLLSTGVTAYSPIVSGHQLAELIEEAQNTHKFWMEHCRRMLQRASALHILCLPGWEISKGVGEETLFAESLCKPILHIEEKDYARVLA